MAATPNRAERAGRQGNIGTRSVLVMLGMAFLLNQNEARSSDDVPSLEYRVKAAFLFNFAKFVEWPSAGEVPESSTFTLCVLGADLFGRILEQTVDGKNVKGKPIVVLRVKTAAEAMTCRVVYLSPSERSHIPEMVKVLAAAAVLTVSEVPGFAERGGMINFIIEDGRVQFQINPKSAGQVGLRISSHLLRLARVVGGKSGGVQ